MSDAIATKLATGIWTHCVRCVFADYDGDTQEGCTLGRIEKFEAAGAEVVGLDDGGTRYLAVNRFCNACHDEASPHLKGVPPAGRAEHVRKLVRARVAFVILACDGSTGDDLRRSLDSLAGQVFPPAKVVVVLDGTPITPEEAIGIVSSSGTKCPWEVVRPEPPGDEDREAYAYDQDFRAVDIGVTKLDPRTATYYAAADAGHVWHPEFIARIDRAINEEMISLAAVEVDEVFNLLGDAVLLSLHNHPSVCGNRGEPLWSKVVDMAGEPGSGVRIMAFEDLPTCE